MKDNVPADYLVRARAIIRSAEDDLGPLDDGARRDLLADNTEWDTDFIWDVVDELEESLT